MRFISPSKQGLVRGGTILGLVIGLAAAGLAQEPEPAPPVVPVAPVVTPQSTQARIDAVQNSTDLDPAVRTRLLEIYGKVQEQLRTAAEFQTRTEQLTKLIREFPETLARQQSELRSPLPALGGDLAADTPLSEAQQQLAQAESELAQAQAELKAVQDETKRRNDRRIEIPKQVEGLQGQLQELERQLQAKAPAEDTRDPVFANRRLLEARKLSVSAEIPALQAELRYLDVTGDQIPIQRDLAARSVAQREAQVSRLREDVTARRKREAEHQAQESRRVAAKTHPALKTVADRNAELARLRQALAETIAASTRELEQIDQQVKQLDERFQKTRKRVEMGHRSKAIGLLLRKQREELPSVSRERTKMHNRASVIADTSLELIDYEDERADLATLDGKIAETLNGATTELDPEEQLFLEFELRDLLQTQRTYLDAIVADTNRYLDNLVEQDVREQQLISRTIEYGEFCDERILWIRSAPAVGWATVRDAWASLAGLFDRKNWDGVGDALYKSAVDLPWTWLGGLAAFVGLAAGGSTLRRRLILMGEQAARGSCRTVLPTVRAVVISLLLAIPWPLLLLCVGLHLLALERTTEFTQALGMTFVSLAVTLAPLEFVRQVCRRHGLADAHFGWDATALATARRSVVLAMLGALPLAGAVHLFEAQSNEVAKNSVGRLAFMGLMLVLAVALYRVTSPRAGVLVHSYRQHPNAWWTHGRWGWLVLVVGVPILLCGLAGVGYYYTALRLASYSLATAWLVLSLVLAYGLLLRWTLIAYRNLGMQRLQERRAAAEASGTAPASQPLEIKLADVNQGTRRTLQLVLATTLVVGMGGIWANVFPALGILRHVELWSVDAGTGPGGETLRTAVTLADIGVALLALALTVAIGRNIPSLLELTLLKHLPLDAGARYAIGTVAKYLITTAGAALAFVRLGLEWSQVQWLVAAVSVGLGFGLQEIFANFVSGLVLLFERPIRIGDIVTVGDITGKVSNIRIRSTTITDWDMRELVVPNKEFITSRVINWTLSTTVSRMSIHVGVAYGTPPDKVRTLLLDVADQHPLVLKDPPPHALLDEFAESTLGFILRVHMPTRDVYLQLRHELLTAIATRFHEAGIEIAFPQRDLHIRWAESSVQRLDEDRRRTKSA